MPERAEGNLNTSWQDATEDSYSDYVYDSNDYSGSEKDRLNNSSTTTDTGTGTTDTSSGTGTTDTGSGTGTGTTGTGTETTSTVVAGDASESGQINVADYSGQQALNPELPGGTSMVDANAATDYGDAAQIDGSKYTQYDYQDQTAQTGTAQTVATTAQADQVQAKDAQTVDAQTTYDQVANEDMTAAQGQINQNNLVTAPQADMQGLSTGRNADGSINYTGQALNESVTQNMSNVIDTSTAAGKALAEKLGQFNYVDSKATMKGQLELLQQEFTDENGNPKIPAWAAATARSVGRIAAFKGMTGTAATAAMAQALMEASLPIAQQDSQFFQTLTIQNLTNKQAQVLNKANVLAKFDLTNLDNRMTAAVENAKAFLQMDLANLSNEQQARIINTQNRVQSILEDAKAINTARMFNADQQNQMSMFYDNLNSNIQMFNAEQLNAMNQFNAAEQNEMTMFNADQINSMTKFNEEMKMRADEFYKTMQYNVDVSNANWRQEITLQDNLFKYNAAATDIKNKFDISQESLNRIWDRSDALLDYLWKSGENDEQRDHELTLYKMKEEFADEEGMGSIFGSIFGDAAGSLFSSWWS